MRRYSIAIGFLILLLTHEGASGQVFGCFTTSGDRRPCEGSGDGYGCGGSLAITQSAFMACMNHNFKLVGDDFYELVPNIVNANPMATGQDVVGMNEHVCFRLGDCIVLQGISDGFPRCYNNLNPMLISELKQFSGILGGPTCADIWANQGGGQGGGGQPGSVQGGDGGYGDGGYGDSGYGDGGYGDGGYVDGGYGDGGHGDE